MWGTVQATQARNTGNWPALLATETPGPGSGAGFANGFMTVSNVSVTDSNYTVLNDTPNISTSGGYIKITGRGFVSGCVVYVGGVAATSTTFISSTEVRAQIAAATSNTLMVYVVNPDGGTGIKLSSLVFSGTPSWVTGETLTSQIADTTFSISFSATSDSAVTYTLNTGSTLPPGTSLFANGLFTGAVTGLNSDTTYSFSVIANDAENQDTARTFSVTFSVGEANFYLTSVLLNAEGNIWIKDSSPNGFTSTVVGDARPSAFSPYNLNWSGYFDGTGDNLSIPNGASQFGTSDYAIEFWLYFITLGQPQILDARASGTDAMWFAYLASGDSKLYYGSNNTTRITSDSAMVVNRWYHVVISRVSTITRMFINGTAQTTTYTDSANYTNAAPLLVGQFGGGGGNLNGYISNFRILIGSGYTSVTVPTAPLTAIENTRLLTLHTNRFTDGSTNAYTITKSGDAAIRSFGPFTETDTFSGSGYFDGTGDYLDLTGSSNLAFGTSDWTIELWIYFISVAGDIIIYDSRPASTNGAYPTIYKHSDNSFRYYTNTGERIASTTSVVAGTWYNVAVAKVSGSTRMFVNGIVQTTVYSDSVTYLNGASRPRIGDSGVTAGAAVNAYISDLRVIKGTGLYTANFTPATTSLTSVANTQLLTLQYRVGENSHRFVDEGGNKYVPVRTGEVYQGTFSPFSPAGWSAYFDGSGDYLTVVGSSNLAFGANDFTIECFVYFNDVSTSGFIYDSRTAGSQATPTLYFGGGNIFYYVSGSIRITSSTIVTNQWYHILVSRVSGSTRMFLNGTQTGSTYTDATTYINNTNRPLIGTNGDATNFFLNGYISNLRVLNGTGYTTVTVPTSRLTTTSQGASNCQLLTLQDNRFVDNSTNAFAITRVNDVKTQAFSPFRASAAYSPTLHGGSAYFDGSGDYLKALSTSNTLLPANNTNTFTIDGWLYPTTTGSQKWIIGDMQPDSTGNNVSVDISASNKIELYWYTGSGNRAISADSLQPNQWNYFAIVVNANAITIYVNSTTPGQTGTTTLTTRSLATTGWGIGQYANAEQFVGFMSGMRWSTGIARTISAIPTAPPAPDNYTTLLLNFTHSGIIDHSGRYNIYTYTGTNIRSSNVQSKFGGGSISFTGSYQWLFIGPGNTSTYPPLLPTIGDYTVEFWVYATASDTTLMCLNTTLSVYAACRLAVNANGSVGFLVSTSSPNVINIATGAGTFAYNTWQHIAVVRNGGTHTVYINGTNRASSTTIAAATAVQGGVESVLGCIDNRNNSDFASFFQGYIDDFRVTRYARYTADFTPPTTAFLTR
jgi:hypothetical protein